MSELEKAAAEAYRIFYSTMFNQEQRKEITHADVSINFYLMGVKWLMSQIEEINGEPIADSQFWGHHAKAWELEEKLKHLFDKGA